VSSGCARAAGGWRSPGAATPCSCPPDARPVVQGCLLLKTNSLAPQRPACVSLTRAGRSQAGAVAAPCLCFCGLLPSCRCALLSQPRRESKSGMSCAQLRRTLNRHVWCRGVPPLATPHSSLPYPTLYLLLSTSAMPPSRACAWNPLYSAKCIHERSSGDIPSSHSHSSCSSDSGLAATSPPPPSAPSAPPPPPPECRRRRRRAAALLSPPSSAPASLISPGGRDKGCGRQGALHRRQSSRQCMDEAVHPR